MLLEGLQRRKRWIAVLSIAVVPILLWMHFRPVGDSLRATFLDVGQGDSVFLQTPSGETVLIDGGGRPNESGEDRVGPRVVEPALRRAGISRIDLMILSHPHDDHLKGLVTILRDFPVGAVLDPGIPHPSKSYRSFLSIIKERGIAYRLASRGQGIDLGDGVTARVLAPRLPHLQDTRDDINNNSVVIQFQYGKSKMLFTGDAGAEEEEDILATGLDVRSDLLKVGHHGSATSTTDEWLDAVRPEVAIISVGRKNAFGHPSPDTLGRLTSHGAKVYRTDRCGAVIVWVRRDSREMHVTSILTHD